jgi:DNA primase
MTPVEQIKQKLNIVDVVSAYVTLTQAGNTYKGKCPFHNEKTPSFFVSPERGTYYCFGCGAKGDIFSFVQQFEGLDFMGSLKLLAEKAGVEITHQPRDNKTDLYQILEEATQFFEKNLTKHPEVRDYLHKRGLTDETIQEFRIGWVANEWRAIHDHLKKYQESDVEKVGLIKKTEKGYYDRFRGRIMFPISDSSGRVIAFTGRIFVDDGESAKYLNSPDTVLYDKGTTIYALDKAKNDIRKKNYTILVEGQMDLIMSHQAGIKNTVAVSGTALTEHMLTTLRRYTPNVIIAFDSDTAGKNAAYRASLMALALGMDVKVSDNGEKDPADLILKNPESWKDVLRKATPIVEFELEQILATVEKRKQSKAIIDKVLPIIASISSEMQKSQFVRLIKEKTGIPEEAIWEDIQKIKKKDIPQKEIEKPPVIEKHDLIIKKIFGIAYATQDDTLLKEIEKILGARYVGISKDMEMVKGELMFEFEMRKGNVEKEKIELIKNLEEDVLKKRFTEIMQEITKAEKAKDNKRAEELLKECQVITNRLREIKDL